MKCLSIAIHQTIESKIGSNLEEKSAERDFELEYQKAGGWKDPTYDAQTTECVTDLD